MTTWIDAIRPYYDVVSDQVVAATAGISPDRPARATLQRDRFPIEMNVPPAWVKRQYGQIAATAWTTQVDGSVLKADPYLTGIDRVKIGQHLDEYWAELQRHRSSTGPCAMCGFSIRNLWRNEVDFDTY